MLTSTQTASHNFGNSQQYPVFSRDLYLLIAQSALEVEEYRFAQEVTLGWLSAYPGDLHASLLYAHSLIGGQRLKQAVRVLEGLCQVDPEFIPAVEALRDARRLSSTETISDGGKNIQASLDESTEEIDNFLAEWSTALSGSQGKRIAAQGDGWGTQLFQVRQQVSEGAFTQAQAGILPVLGQDLESPLPAVTHLEMIAQSRMAPLAAMRSLADHYLRRWPDCMVCKLYLAEALIDAGETAQGVSLLHEAVRRDVGGQVADRLWGQGHRYTSLWPTPLELGFRWIIPASVAAKIGWNKLPAGELVFLAGEPKPLAETQRIQTIRPAKLTVASSIPAAVIASEAPVPEVVISTYEVKSLDVDILPVQSELYRIADRLNRPEIKGLDTRFPVYVIMTMGNNLTAKYGEQAADQILAEAASLAIKVQSYAATHADMRWGSRLYLADRPESSGFSNLQAAHPSNATAIKTALVELDDSLAKHGERIGALLILGGPDIVPFHLLPNPVDDQDQAVPSDNPYACRGDNYFLPEWPVGRLPDSTGSNPALLLNQLHRLGRRYLNPDAPRRGYQAWFGRLVRLIRRVPSGPVSSFGYTAAVWKQASASVFKVIGKSSHLHSSPPYGVEQRDTNQKTVRGVPTPSGQFAYFNLHGLVDAGEWFGQREIQASGRDPDYPVALRPQDVQQLGYSNPKPGNARLPQIIFSEACYGANIVNKSAEEALSLCFLEAGAGAVVGSTAMSYGSINAPLIAADYLGFHFWTCIRAGIPVGEALRQAKLRLAQEMNTRQGYLDGEDQKTLISFVLYGDPLLQIIPNPSGKKSITRSLQPPVEISTVCDRTCQLSTNLALSEGMMNSIREVVVKYLPDMQGAEIKVSNEPTACSGNGQDCPNHQLFGKAVPVKTPNRRTVTLRKSFHSSERKLTQFARLTLNGDEKVVKLVISR